MGCCNNGWRLRERLRLQQQLRLQQRLRLLRQTKGPLWTNVHRGPFLI